MREKLMTLPLAELRKIAKEQGLKAVSSLRKSELVDKLCEMAQEPAKAPEAAAPVPEPAKKETDRQEAGPSARCCSRG